MQKFNYHCTQNSLCPTCSNIRGPVFYMQITQTYQEGHNMHTQHGSCSYCFCFVIQLIEIFFSSQMILRIYIFFQALYHLYQCSFFVSSPFCSKQKRTHIEKFSILVLVSTSYKLITFCLIVSMNRQTSNIQISSTQPSHNLTYSNSPTQIHASTQPRQKLIFSSK